MNKKGQTTLVLILLAAAVLVVFAISMNWGRIAQIKTMTQVAATNGAALMASDYASYGESVLQTSLGGRWKYCQSTSIWVALIALIIIVVAVVACGGACLAGGLFFLSALAVTLAVANLALQVMVVQPGLTRLWNRMQQNLPTQTDRFLEQALQTGFQGTVNDPAVVWDYFDLNTNGKFGSTNGTTPDDTVSRFGFYYTERLKGVGQINTTFMVTAQAALLGFINGGSPTYPLALTTPCGGPDGNVNSPDPHCNPCCQADPSRRPEECRNDADALARCSNTSIWRYAASYPFVYDPSYPDYYNVNTGSSFLAQFGLDAEVRSIPNTYPGPFNREDTLPQDRAATPIAHGGIFSFHWDQYTLWTDPHCAPGSKNPGNIYLVNCSSNSTAEQCVSSAPSPDCDSRISDAVSTTPNFNTPANECAELPNPDTGFNPSPMAGTWWKPGTDLYCSTTWPYDQCGVGCPTLSCDPSDPNCVNYGSNCGCTPSTAPQIQNDPLDDLVYGLKQFYAWVRQFATTDPTTLMTTKEQWGPQASFWVGPPCNTSSSSLCFADGNGDDEHQGGMLFRYHHRLQKWQSLLNQWLTGTYTAANAWCLPPDPAAFQTSYPDEYAAITAGGAPWGSLQSVWQCLDYNAAPTQDYDLSVAPPIPLSNYARFNQCLIDLGTTCNNGALPASCEAFPRSLISAAPPAFSGNCEAYTAWVKGSRDLAGALGSNLQGDKFRARSALLKHMQKKASDVAGAMGIYATQMENYASSPGYALLLRIADSSNSTAQLSNAVVYGWQDTKPTSGRADGYWHIVKVEGQLPGRCVGYNCQQTRLAWVRTYTRGFLGLTRCYELTDYAGQVRMKVTRWDENHDLQKFQNKIPLWQVRYGPSTVNPGNISNQLRRRCFGQYIGVSDPVLQILNDPALLDPETKAKLQGAFMFGEGDINSIPAANADCQETVDAALAQGISSQVCARYDLDGPKQHMTIKFVPCS